MESASATDLILASTSKYRRELLSRLVLRFKVFAPEVDETPLPGEAPRDIALRLARLKTSAARAHHPGALIIGSDQVAECNGRLLEKPGSLARAREQLQSASGRAAVFHTAVALLNTVSGRWQDAVVETRVRFRRLSPHEIDRYLEREPACDCAGSAKVEGLGIALMETVRSEDPTALIGLPLIALCGMLRQEGIALP